MTIDLLISTDDNRVINKSKITPVVTKECKIYGECDILNPEILLDYDESILKANYCYISEWGRYYWLVNYRLNPGMICILELTCDVLNSWKPYINNLSAVIARSSTGGNNLLPDSSIPIETDTPVKNIQASASPFSSDEGCYVLTVLGGGESS